MCVLLDKVKPPYSLSPKVGLFARQLGGTFAYLTMAGGLIYGGCRTVPRKKGSAVRFGCPVCQSSLRSVNRRWAAKNRLQGLRATGASQPGSSDASQSFHTSGKAR